MVRLELGLNIFWHIHPSLMDVLDRNDIKGNYLVADTAAIHTPAKVRDLVESRGYTRFVSSAILTSSEFH
jgi:hypothetical protein